MFCITERELRLIEDINMLWMQHSEWTGMTIGSIVLDTPNQEVVINRLLKNPVDFGILLRKFYGDAIAFGFSDLLIEHLTLAGDLVEALSKQEEKNAEEIRKKWYENADEISVFLASINPYWNYNEWKDMFLTHLTLAEKMAVQLIDEKYAESIATYDLFESEVMMMSKVMYEGILEQFYRVK